MHNRKILVMNSNIHWRTPQLSVIDGRGLPVRQVDYLRTGDGEPQQTLITRQRHDAAGRVLEQWDSRLFGAAPKANVTSIYGLNGVTVKIDSVDSGERLGLPGLANELLHRWDQRGNHSHYRYDSSLRLVDVTGNTPDAAERYIYADNSADAENNLRGELIEQVSPSISLALNSYSLHGQALRETRTFVGETDTFVTHLHLDPQGNVLQLTDAGGHRQQSRFDIAGQLLQVSLWLATANQAETVVGEIRYNADGQRIEQLAGNGVRSTWFYDPADSRLLRMLARKDRAKPLQDLHYEHDPIGNVLRIEDHTLATVYFANQRVDADRHFAYDSLNRLTKCRGFESDIPHQLPGVPQLIQPIDPGRRFQYTELFRYNTGGNLVELQHLRKGHNFSQKTLIDPHNNRGVRWQSGDAEPIFREHFDTHGNQLKRQPGTLPLEWDSRDQLSRTILLRHSNGLPDDEEICRYSEGERIYKCSLTHTPSITHRREVHYLPGLEIHTRSDGQQLHVIVLPDARCLHWTSGQPEDIEIDQLRYSLNDRLGSCALELDRRAGVISLEHYYAFGGTAWWASRSALEASYKTIRYSGKEMDASGLYYYGARYYAPWLQRWISADPAGDVDGLNLYAFVGNNPIGFIDSDGLAMFDVETPSERDQRKAQSARRWQLYRAKQNLSQQIDRHVDILKLSLRRGIAAQQQILNHRSTSDFALSTLRRGGTHVAGQIVSYAGGIAVGIGAQALGAVAPGVGNAVGVAMGFGAKKLIGSLWDYAAEHSGASASIKFKASQLSPEKIIQKAEYKTMSPLNYMQQKYTKMLPDTRKGALKAGKEITGTAVSLIAKSAVPGAASEISATAGLVLGTVEIAHEISGAVGDLSAEKTAKGDRNLTNLIDALNNNMSELKNQFETVGVGAMHTFSPFGETAGDTVDSLQQATVSVIHELTYTRTMLRSRSSRFTAV
jgi:insecticidal toxin complex protein TccC